MSSQVTVTHGEPCFPRNGWISASWWEVENEFLDLLCLCVRLLLYLLNCIYLPHLTGGEGVNSCVLLSCLLCLNPNTLKNIRQYFYKSGILMWVGTLWWGHNISNINKHSNVNNLHKHAYVLICTCKIVNICKILLRSNERLLVLTFFFSSYSPVFLRIPTIMQKMLVQATSYKQWAYTFAREWNISLKKKSVIEMYWNILQKAAMQTSIKIFVSTNKGIVI